MATAVRRCDTKCITQCSMSGATPKAHWMLASGNYSLCIAPAATRATGKQTTINKYTYKAGCFDGHGDAPVRNRVHCPMEEVQRFTRSHWMPPLGKY
jgi:hypothetical protein